jgi:hypothetical protein
VTLSTQPDRFQLASFKRVLLLAHSNSSQRRLIMQIQSLININVPMNANRVAAASLAWLEEQDQEYLLFNHGGASKLATPGVERTNERDESEPPQVYDKGGQATQRLASPGRVVQCQA